MLDHIREAIWADLMEVSGTPGGGALTAERVNRLLTLEQIEVDRLVAVLADVLPDKFAAALELAIDCVPCEEREIPYPDNPRGVGEEWVPRGAAQFKECFPPTIEGGVDLADELARAGSKRALAAEWGIDSRSVTMRAKRILRQFPGEPALDRLAAEVVIWSVQQG
jgi:hypothetical protein